MTFGPYRVDLAEPALWRGKRKVDVRPRSLAVLRYLIENRGRVVGKRELLDAVWGDTHVSGGVLKVCVREIRVALRDDAGAPRVIETVGRSGYRWIAPVTVDEGAAPRAATRAASTTAARVVGRDDELRELRRALADARRGERRVVLVGGEVGIGKTTLLDLFLATLPADEDAPVWVARGQCIDHFGSAEPYLPVLAALGDLGRSAAGPRLEQALDRHAPTWLVQLPVLARRSRRDALVRRAAEGSRERMLREIAGALEALTGDLDDEPRPSPTLILAIEDLQWCDTATVDALDFVARGRSRAKLLVIGTYRPVDLILREHALRDVKQALVLQNRCSNLLLAGLGESAVERWLESRFGAGTPRLAGLARILRDRTEGNPLFMVNVFAEWAARGVLVEDEGGWRMAREEREAITVVPENLLQMLEMQVERLGDDEQKLLAVASVVGMQVSPGALAAGLAIPVEEAEVRGERIARRAHILRAASAGRYEFVHALHRDAIYARLGSGRRAALHQRIGEWMEGAHGARAHEVAAELADHFQRSADYRRAVRYLAAAAENAVRRFSPEEAIALAHAGLELVPRLEDRDERAAGELQLRALLGPSLMAKRGWKTAARDAGYSRARELSRELGETDEFFWMTLGLWAFHLIRGEHSNTRQLVEQLLGLAGTSSDAAFLVGAHCAAGSTSFYAGEPTAAREHLLRVVEAYDPAEHARFALHFGVDPGVIGLGYLGLGALWPLGYPRQALERARESCALADDLGHPHSRMLAYACLAWIHERLHDVDGAHQWADRCVEIAAAHEIVFWRSFGITLRAWATSRRGGEASLVEIADALRALRDVGALALLPQLLVWQAQVLEQAARFDEASDTLGEALRLTEITGERYCESEIHRLRGRVMLARGDSPEAAESAFQDALGVARAQRANAWRLRAAVSLGRLWQDRGDARRARKLVGEACEPFTEGFETADYREAETLLAELG